MIFIPTPRQSEQIYLAEEMRRRKIGLVYNEIEELDLESIDFGTCVGFRPVENKELQPIIRRWVEGL
jgi:hypothetical protein